MHPPAAVFGGLALRVTSGVFFRLLLRVKPFSTTLAIVMMAVGFTDDGSAQLAKSVASSIVPLLPPTCQ